ncbi:hypothetical protein PHLCEN_2v8358 [Hermanssonia centrifuga]|uniref:F-box domain-containing protein n=1 Tax=Hermanssonia centrifuga TaxID=98765 RepID=A0A2R6NTX0_9APHY|nr:hypothetical protein PHLCEN_2v8358 [Hermanssonia centrifuga]
MVDNPAKSSGPQQGSSDSNQISTTQRSKKRFKRDNERTQREDPPRCHLNTIPLEILAEILSYTTPRDILALARSNKFFCATFANNPSSTFIWKRSRADFNPNAIPDPTPNFTEASYAAFLFDPGECEVRVHLFVLAKLNLALSYIGL